jgi:hypothetical protein
MAARPPARPPGRATRRKLRRMSVEQHRRRYENAMHAVQSGVAAKMNYDRAETTPKHLRVGVNAAMVGHAAMARLLMAKGIISEEEYAAAQADAAEAEQRMYEAWLSDQTGGNVSL